MITARDGRQCVSGPMTMQTAAMLLAEGEPLAAAGDCVFDLSGAETTDSSALAVVLGWCRAAAAADKKVTLTAAPESFLSLASLYGVTELLPLIDSGEVASGD